MPLYNICIIACTFFYSTEIFLLSTVPTKLQLQFAIVVVSRSVDTVLNKIQKADGETR